jgi:DNA-binding HxlR family transcriptional regulator
MDCQVLFVYTEAMRRDYEEICGLARGLDVVGERWTLLIARELLYGPRRFTDLLGGLPGIPPSLLSRRLKEMQAAGIISKTVLPPPAASMVYQLTEAGKALEQILYALGRWGAQFGRTPRPSDAVRPEWIVFALHSIFRPDAANGAHVTAELHLPEGTFHLDVNHGALTTGLGSRARSDLVLTGERALVLGVLMGRLTLREATLEGKIKIQGDRKVLQRFLKMFGVGATASTEHTSEKELAQRV